MLEGNGEAIRERRNFVISNAPGKVHQQVGRYREMKARVRRD